MIKKWLNVGTEWTAVISESNEGYPAFSNAQFFTDTSLHQIFTNVRFAAFWVQELFCMLDNFR